MDLIYTGQQMFLGSHGSVSAYGKVASDATAYPARDAWYCFQYGTNADYAVGNPSYNAMQTMQAALTPYATGQKYYNNVDLETPLTSYFGGNMARLKDLKKKYDPTNLFNGPMTIPLP